MQPWILGRRMLGRNLGSVWLWSSSIVRPTLGKTCWKELTNDENLETWVVCAGATES